MNSVIRNVWKGTVLGGILGFLGGEIFIMILGLETSLKAVWYGFFFYFSLGQILAVLPGTVLGAVLGAILGLVFGFVRTESPIRTRITISILVSIFYHLAILSVNINFPIILNMGHITLFDSYFDYWVLIWFLYLFAAYLFALNFHRNNFWPPKLSVNGGKDLT